MLRRRLPAADLAERYARVFEIEVGVVLSHLAGGLRLTLGELGIVQDVARAERFGALERHPGHVRARPLAFEIGIAPRRSRSPIGGCAIGRREAVRLLSLDDEDEGDDTEDAQRHYADRVHGFS